MIMSGVSESSLGHRNTAYTPLCLVSQSNVALMRFGVGTYRCTCCESRGGANEAAAPSRWAQLC